MVPNRSAEYRIRSEKSFPKSNYPQKSEDFCFWIPPANAKDTDFIISPLSNMRLRSSPTMNNQKTNPVLVEQPRTKPNRPRMGISNIQNNRPVLTSTPSIPPFQNQLLIEEPNNDPNEEPVYCEILKDDDSPEKKPPLNRNCNNLPPIKPTLGVPQRIRNELRNSNRRYGGDFSYYKPIPVGPVMATTNPQQGLGRRAYTQLEMRVPQQCVTRNNAVGLYQQRQSRNNLTGFTSDSDFTASRRNIPLTVKRIQQRAIPNEYISDSTSEIGTSIAADDVCSIAGSTSTDMSSSSNVIKKGLLWQQRDKMFSRWKERFFILTSEYLQCFKRGTSRMTEMGGFVFKLRLTEIENVELVDKKGYLTIVLSLSKENAGKIFLRRTDGLQEWCQSIQDCIQSSKSRQGIMKSTKQFWSKKQFTDSSSMEQWILARQSIEKKYNYSETESVISSASTQLSSVQGLKKNSRLRLKEFSKSNLNMALKNPITTFDYGFIDEPISSTKSDFHTNYDNGVERTTSISPISVDWNRKIVKDSSSTFSEDSGVDSMNTQISRSVLSPTPSCVSAPRSRIPIYSPRYRGAKTPQVSVI